MDYTKDFFLQNAWRRINIRAFEKDVEDRRAQAASWITREYERSPELKNYLICRTVSDLASRTVVNGQLIHGVWRQLTGILHAYWSGQIDDIGISAFIVVNHIGQNGAPVTGTSAMVHDRGNGKISIEATDQELRRTVREALDAIGTGHSRPEFFERIETTIKQYEKPERTYTVDVHTYLYLNGEENTRLLELSPNSFMEEDVHDDMDERPHEYRHVQDLLEELDEDQLKHLLEYCGIQDGEETRKLVDNPGLQDESKRKMVFNDLKGLVWRADREDFYREYGKRKKDDGG